jgi:hypothetical protein
MSENPEGQKQKSFNAKDAKVRKGNSRVRKIDPAKWDEDSFCKDRGD